MNRHARPFVPAALRDNSAAETRRLYTDAKRFPQVQAAAAAAERERRAAEAEFYANNPLPEPPPVSYEQAAGRVERRGLFDQTGTRDDEPPRMVTVYAVALIFQPREDGTAYPIVTLRQFVRDGRRPLTDKAATTHATEVECANWKASRAPLELFGPPTGIVTYQIIPASA